MMPRNQTLSIIEIIEEFQTEVIIPQWNTIADHRCWCQQSREHINSHDDPVEHIFFQRWFSDSPAMVTDKFPEKNEGEPVKFWIKQAKRYQIVKKMMVLV